MYEYIYIYMFEHTRFGKSFGSPAIAMGEGNPLPTQTGR